MLVFFQRTTFWRILAGAMFAITLPYYFLSGTRSGFLAVTLPFIVTYLFYGRHLLILKLAILAVAFFCLKEGFKFVQVFRLMASERCWLIRIRMNSWMTTCKQSA